MKSNVVSIRLENDLRARFTAEAQAHKMSLSSYLAERLEKDDHLGSEIAALRRAIEASLVGPATPSGGPPAMPEGALVEVVLLLRSLAGPQNANLAQKEVERRGMQTWR